MNRTWLPAAGVFAALVAAAPAAAQDDANAFSVDGYYRARGFYLTEPDLNEASGKGVERYFQHRLRLWPHLFVNEKLSFHLMADAMDDQVWGANPGNVLAQSTADETANFIVKRAYGEVLTPVGLFRVGRQGSHWGKGLLSNDGDGFRNEFGDAHFGDTYDRILFATKPLGKDGPLTTALLYDKIVETDLDIFQSISERQIGDPLVLQKGDVDEFGLVVHYQKESLTAGVYGIYRTQTKTDTTAWIPDVYLKYDNGSFHADLEAVGIFGESRGVTVFLAPGDVLDGRRISQLTLTQPRVDIGMLGGATEIGYRFDQWDVAVEAGYASGDKGGTGAFDDGELSAFSFDPDYNVGLLMFEEGYRLFTLNSLLAARDTFFNQPAAAGVDATPASICAVSCVNNTFFATRQEAIDDFFNTTAAAFVPTNGSVKNAIYAFPKVRFQPWETTSMVLGFLWAKANEPVPTRFTRPGAADPEESTDYGFEVDYAINYNYTENLMLGLQAGWFRPGEIFRQPNGDSAPNMFEVQPRFTVTF